MAIILRIPESANSANYDVAVVCPNSVDEGTSRATMVKEACTLLKIDGEGATVVKQDSGRPVLLTSSGSYPISFSHTGTQLIMALSKKADVGIDIERKNRVVSQALQKRILCDGDGPGMHCNNPVLLWTIKESFLKMMGTGLRHGMNKVHVEQQNKHLFNVTTGVQQQLTQAKVYAFTSGNFQIALSLNINNRRF